MPVIIVVGGHWGDEGKGKVIDYLAGKADLVVRYQGGDNAGHTVVSELEGQIILHVVPSGIVQGKISAIGSGELVNPKSLMNEIAFLEKRRNMNVKGNLFIDERANIIYIHHRVQDLFEEYKRSMSGTEIGTTAKGIGPAYTDMARRNGTRIIEFIGQNFRSILEEKTMKAYAELSQDPLFSKELLQNFLRQLSEKEEKANKELLENSVIRPEHVDFERFYSEDIGFDIEAIFEDYSKAAEKIRPLVRDVAITINEFAYEGKTVLLEGAQGTFLDVNLGTVPNVTSSHPVAGGAALIGIGPTRINEVVVVYKAYTTRVGEGPFPTRMDSDFESSFREKTGEYGATTGRARKIGWFDAVAARTAAYLNGIDAIAITRLDDLSGIEPLKICAAYKYGDKMMRTVPNDMGVLNNVEPIYEYLPGFKEDISSIRDYNKLPNNAKAYVQRIKQLIREAPYCREADLKYIGVGPGRDQMIVLR